ncbi:uroporphyrinogen-III C-methyltransferase [Pelistega ratti]|uniref:uroporphyrinogen-III C-methyltransferase n=1 Tax=Pelistega ratti TaxID=2652177 RepID=UPI00135C90C3|nr:uroporphyrinogen-III C-methyltransferase [Pelistega ratti]
MDEQKSTLEQVETKPKEGNVDTKKTSSTPNTDIVMMTMTHAKKKVKEQKKAENVSESPVDDINQAVHSDQSIEQAPVEESIKESSTAEEELPLEQKSSKGGLGKTIAIVACLAALGGGAYYAQQQGWLNDLIPSSTTPPSVSTQENTTDNTVHHEVSTTEADTPVMAESTENSSVTEPPSMAHIDHTPTAEASVDIPVDIASEVKTPADTSITNLQEEEPKEAVSTESEQTTNVVSTQALVLDNQAINPAADSEEVIYLKNRINEQNQQIAQLTQQLQATQHEIANQQTQLQKTQQSLVTDILRYYNAADFERTVNFNKDRTIKALSAIQVAIADQRGEQWSALSLAIDKDISALNTAKVADINALFNLSKALDEALQTAPFMSPESVTGVVPSATSSMANTSEVDQEIPWLDRAINQVERLPAEAFEAIRSDLGGLVRVEKLSDPALATLSLAEVKLQREATLAQLRIAQEALLKREDAIWKSAMQKVEQQLMKYYNLNAEKTQQAIAIVRQLIATPIHTDLPKLSYTQQVIDQINHDLSKEN